MTEREYRSRLKHAFSLAEEMCGSHHPDEIEDDRAVVREVYRETLKRINLIETATETATVNKRVNWMDLKQAHAPHTGDCGDTSCHFSPSWDGIVRLKA